MARRKKRRRSSGGKSRSRSRRTFRRNPSGVVRQLPGAIVSTGIKAGETVAGIVGARFVRGKFKQQPGTIVGSLIEAGVGTAALIAGAFAGAKVREHLEQVAVGCFAAPIMSGIGQLQIPGVSSSLGDDGVVVGPGTGLTLVSAFPDDYAGVAGDDNLGEFVAGESGLGADPWVTGAAA